MTNTSRTDALPLVDVVVATRDRPELLRKALDAVMTQDYAGAICCTVVFDRTEPDLQLEHDDGHRMIRVVSNKRSAGLAGARNTGIEAGSAPYVAFCDDDDAWLPQKLTAQIAALEADATALTSVTGIVVVYGDHEAVRTPLASDMTLDTLARNRVMEAHPSTVVVRRASLEGDIGLVDEEIPGSYGEDFDWILRAAAAGGFAVVEQPLVRIRWGQSMFSQNWQTIIDAIDYGLDKHEAFHRDSRALARLYGRRSFALAALGKRREALRGVGKTLRTNVREPRTYLAAAVALRLVSAERLMDLAHRRGHGI